MKKNLKIIIPAIAVVIVAIVGVLLVVNNNQQEQVKGTTTEVVKTTLKEAITTEKEVDETETETLVETIENVTETTQSTTKVPEITKRPVTNSSGNSSSSVATTQKPTTTKSSEPVDINIMGDIEWGDTARAGLFYTYDEGKLTTYDEIPEGSRYYYYDSNGNRGWFVKRSSVNQEAYPFNYCKYCSYKLVGVEPNAEMTCPSCKNFIDTSDFAIGATYCAYCGKNREGKTTPDGNWIPPYQLGGCSRFSMDTECAECGKIVPAYTCFHGCSSH